MRGVAHDAARAHVQHGDLDLAAAPRPAEDVAVDRAFADDLLALHGLLDRRDAVAQARRVFVALVVRRRVPSSR